MFAGRTHDAINRNGTASLVWLENCMSLVSSREHFLAQVETHDRKLSRLLDQGRCSRKSPQDCERIQVSRELAAVRASSDSQSQYDKAGKAA